MFRILIVDDKSEKQGAVVNAINKSGIKEDQYEILYATYAIDAKRILSKKMIDVMILDICIPIRVGGELIRDGGIQLLNEIVASTRYTYPRYVIALSEHEDLTKEFQLKQGIIHTSIFYKPQTSEWEIRLIQSISTAFSILTHNIVPREYDYDVAIICALEEELNLVKSWISDLEEKILENDEYLFWIGHFEKDGEKLKVVIANSTHMGMVPAAVLSTKLIYNFTPRYIVMTGIAAGIKGKVNMGDAVVAEYVWDYGAGKEVVSDGNSLHRNTIQQINIDTDVANMVRRLAGDKGKLQEIQEAFMGNAPNNIKFRLHMGAVASGAAVIANSKKIEEIKDQIRDVIAIEMEIFGVYYAAKWAERPRPKFMAVKSICDFGDEEKSDDYHVYASYTSSKVLETLVKDYFDYDF